MKKQLERIGRAFLAILTGGMAAILIFGVIAVGIAYLIASEYTVLGLVCCILILPAGAIVLSILDRIEERKIELEERAERRRERAMQRKFNNV